MKKIARNPKKLAETQLKKKLMDSGQYNEIVEAMQEKHR